MVSFEGIIGMEIQGTDFSKIKQLFGINSPNGFPENEITGILNLVGTLPNILIDYYNELGNYDFNYGLDNLIRLNEKNGIYEYKNYMNEKYVIICCAIENAYSAAIKKTNLLEKNPPVYFSFDMEHWEIGCDNLYNFIHGFAFICAAVNLKNVGSFNTNDNRKAFIRNNFKNKGIKFTNWITYGDIEFYGDYDDTIIMLNEEISSYYASNNKNHFTEMENKLKEKNIEYK